MESTRTDRYADKAGKLHGTLQRFRSGEMHYTNFYPKYEIYFRPQKVPEELVFKRHDDLYTASGWKLRKVFDDFRSNKGVFEWGETEGDYNPDSEEPYILTLKHEWVF